MSLEVKRDQSRFRVDINTLSVERRRGGKALLELLLFSGTIQR